MVKIVTGKDHCSPGDRSCLRHDVGPSSPSGFRTSLPGVEQLLSEPAAQVLCYQRLLGC